MAGPGIAAGVDLGECSTLDLAPTMLHLLGLPVPDYMPGRILDEAFAGQTAIPFRPKGTAALAVPSA